MKKFNFFGKRNISLAAFICLMLTLSLNAFSQNNVNELGELNFGVEYSAPSNSTTVGFFVAPSTDEMVINFRNGYTSGVFTDEECTEELIGTFNNNFLHPAYTYEVEKDKTYYIKFVRFSWDSTIYFTLFIDGVSSQPFEIYLYEPTAGQNRTYNLTTNEQMFVRYSQKLKTAEVEMTYRSNGGETLEADMENFFYIQDDYLFIDLSQKLEALLLEEGETGISTNAPFTVKIRVTNSKGDYVNGSDKDGWRSYQYLCGYLPVRIVSASFPESFLSYWPEGDPAGIASVTYSSPLRTSPAPSVTMRMGNIEGDLGVDLYVSSLPAKVEGNTVSVDFTGVRRSLNDIMTSPPSSPTISITITNIYTDKGVPVVSNAAGTTATYNINLPFVNLPKTTVVSDWVPANGSSLAGVSEMEVWIRGLNSIKFDGFTYEYTSGNQQNKILVSMEEVKITEESLDGDEAVFTFAIPAEVQTAEDVTVYPTNLESYDGYDYYAFLQASFNALTAIFISPSNGSDVKDLTGTKIEADFNYTSMYPGMFVTLEITDLNPETEADAVVYPQTPMTYANGSYSLTVEGKLKLYRGHEYVAEFTAWENEAAYNSGKTPLGRTSAKWFGDTPEYIYSGIKFVSIVPDESIKLKDTDATFILTFNGLVRLDPSNSFYIPYLTNPQTFTAEVYGDDWFTNVDDNRTYSLQWELKVDPAFIAATYPEMELVIVALDEDGRRVRGNKLRAEDTYFSFVYENEPSSSVGQIEAADDIYEIYTITGLYLGRHEGIEAVRALSPGLYIVNGHKILVRNK